MKVQCETCRHRLGAVEYENNRVQCAAYNGWTKLPMKKVIGFVCRCKQYS